MSDKFISYVNDGRWISYRHSAINGVFEHSEGKACLILSDGDTLYTPLQYGDVMLELSGHNPEEAL